MVQHKIYFVIKTFFITYLSLLIMSKVDFPMEPVEPKIAICFFFILIQK